MYFGVIYCKTRNLWLPIALHLFIGICALPYCFTTTAGYPTASLLILVPVYVLLSVYGLRLSKPVNSAPREKAT